MKIDLTSLLEIAPAEAQANPPEPVSSEEESIAEALKGLNGTTVKANTPPKDKPRKPREKKTKPVKDDLPGRREALGRIRRSEDIQIALLKGINEGANPYGLLLKAIEGLSLAVNNPALFAQAKKDITAVYGYGLLEKEALELEAEDIKRRLSFLEERAEEVKGKITQEDFKRIETAIKYHRENLDFVNTQIKQVNNKQLWLRERVKFERKLKTG